jgi:DinB superfamily
MNQESIAASIVKLTDTSSTLRALLDGMDVMKMRVKPNPALFSPLEDAWHLRDIERGGYLVRIRRILTEDVPVLDDLDGDRLAIERRYNERELAPAIDDFACARAESLTLLKDLPADAWARRAQFANHTINQRALIDMMVEHDHGHLSSIRAIYVTASAA